MYVNVILNNSVLKTVKARQKNNTLIVPKTIDGLIFPDTDRLFLEDIKGHLYRRIDFLNPELVFEQI